MDQRQKTIECLKSLNTLLDESLPTTSHEGNKELRELHEAVSAKLKKKYPYTPLDFLCEAF